MAAENNLPSICSVLLQNGVDFAAVDNRGNRDDTLMTSVQCLLKEIRHKIHNFIRGTIMKVIVFCLTIEVVQHNFYLEQDQRDLACELLSLQPWTN